MLDVLLINPAAYRGVPRRGPYELASFRQQLIANGLAAELYDAQDAVGRGALPFPKGHVLAASDELARRPARLVLLTIRTTAGPWALELAREYRSRFPSAVIVAYAPRIESRLRRFMATDDAFDGLCMTSASESIVELAHGVKARGRDGLASIIGLVVGTAATVGEATHPEQDITFQHVDENEPWISPDRSIAALHIGRGCPYRCTFCSAPLGAGGRPRYLSATRIVDDAAAAYDKLDVTSPRFVMLETENLTSNPQLIQEIGIERSRRGQNFRWGAYGRIDHMTADMPTFLRNAGCCFLFFGIETGSARMQKVLSKEFPLSEVIPRIRSLHASRILTQSSFMFGLPGESHADFLATANLIAQVAWSGGCVDWTPLRIEAGTELDRLTRHHPMRLMTNSELYRDLLDGGIDPHHVHPDIGYRMYGLDLPGFDIDAACAVARDWRRLLLDAPLTMYSLHAGLGISIGTLIERLYVQPVGPRLMNWFNFATTQLKHSGRFFIPEIARVELGIQQNSTQFDIAWLYKDLRRSPALIPRVFGLEWWQHCADPSDDMTYQSIGPEAVA